METCNAEVRPDSRAESEVVFEAVRRDRTYGRSTGGLLVVSNDARRGSLRE